MTMDTADDIAAIPGLDDPARAILAARSRRAAAPAGTVLFRPGEVCSQLVLLSSGSVQVRIVSESGRELVLYRVRPGESCVLSFACLINHGVYQAEGICETEVAGRAIDRATLQELLDISPAFRDRMLSIQTARIFDLIGLVDEIAFHRTLSRLAGRLIELAAGGDVVEETHQALATHLGTAREVVSRRLKALEDKGVIALERRRIRIVDKGRLAAAGG